VRGHQDRHHAADSSFGHWRLRWWWRYRDRRRDPWL